MKSFEIDENSSATQLRMWLRGANLIRIKSVIGRINDCTDYSLSEYGNKQELIEQLRGIDQDVLWEAIDTIFPVDTVETCCGENADELEDEDTDESEDECDDESDAECYE